jgi:hypothetical protein
MLTAMTVGVFHCLDALYGERRDRSTLFWKSLPVAVPRRAQIPLSPYIPTPLVSMQSESTSCHSNAEDPSGVEQGESPLSRGDQGREGRSRGD